MFLSFYSCNSSLPSKPQEMESHLLAYCQNHFQTPQGSSYTIPPLVNLPGYDSLTHFGSQILHGTANINALPLKHHTKLLLQHQCTWLPPDHPKFQMLPFEAMLDGFCCQPKCTSTSPSGCHLRIYKSLAKDAHKSMTKCKKNNLEQTQPKPSQPTKQQPKYNGMHVLCIIIHQLLQMAVQHCHTFK